MADTEPDRDHWARVSKQWATWARKPNHDAFWTFAL
jgi:hypothetical protein